MLTLAAGFLLTAAANAATLTSDLWLHSLYLRTTGRGPGEMVTIGLHLGGGATRAWLTSLAVEGADSAARVYAGNAYLAGVHL